MLLAVWLTGFADERELKKMAHNLYVSGQYEEAARLYAQLISKDTTDPVAHYFYGVCLLHTGSNRTEAIRHLENAAGNNQTPVLVFYHLGTAYQMELQFEKAIACFEMFWQKANAFRLAELGIEERIELCHKARLLYQNAVLPEPFHIRETDLSQFAAHYSQSHDKSRLIPVPAQILKGRNKTKFSPFVYVDKNSRWMSFAAPGKGHAKEIQIAWRKNNSSWNPAYPLRFEHPFPFSADNPVIENNGTVIYFSSNAFKYVGGYDLYVTYLNPKTGMWSYPEPLPVPVNSPADEIMLIPDASGRKAFLLSNRNSASGRVGVYEVPLPFPTGAQPSLTSRPLHQEKINSLSHSENLTVQSSQAIPGDSLQMVSAIRKQKQTAESNTRMADSTDCLKITLYGYMYDAARWNLTASQGQLKIHAGEKLYLIPVQYPAGEFSITLPYQPAYELILTDGATPCQPVRISMGTARDSCMLVLVTLKKAESFRLVALTETEAAGMKKFSVQLGAFRSKNPEELTLHFRARGVANVEVIPKANLQAVVTGNNLSLLEALKERSRFISAGFKDAFIVTRHGNKLGLADQELAARF